VLRDHAGNYTVAMSAVLAVAMIGALSIMILPRHREVPAIVGQDGILPPISKSAFR
jgi:hypothetical protein